MMKNQIITVLILLMMMPVLPAQKLVFKDKNLEKAVAETFDTNNDKTIDQSEADKVENLFLNNKRIVSAEDLSNFKNVKIIVLDNNEILGVSLKNMHKLQLFSCARCKMTYFEAANLKNLTSLYLDNNDIENITLKTTPRIDQLTISLNKLKNIDVSSLKFLRRLSLEYNRIKKLDISNNKNLQTLNISENPIKESDLKKGSAEITIFGLD